jgi:hypothetical protein
VKSALLSVRRFDPEERSGLLFGQNIKKTIRSLPDITNPLVQRCQQGFAAQFFTTIVQDDRLQVSAAGHFAGPHAAYEKISLPLREPVSRKNEILATAMEGIHTIFGSSMPSLQACSETRVPL